MTIPGTLARTDQPVVCVFSVDGEDHLYEYLTYESEHIARFTARLLVNKMHHTQNGMRSVSIKREDGTWETIGSFYDVGTVREEEESD
jgi:hypothetical protein